MKNTFTLIIAICVVAMVGMACNFSASTASLGAIKTSKDKDGKQESSSFKSGDTLYASADVSGSIEKTTVKFSLADDKGSVQQGSEVKVELPGSGQAQYHLTVPAGFKGGKFTLNAEMLNDKGEKKDSKSASVTIEGTAGSTPPSTSSDHKDDKSADKDKSKDKDDDDN